MYLPKSRQRLYRRLAFVAAIVAVWLLARGPIAYGPHYGEHDYKGAWLMTAFLVVIALVWERWDRDKPEPQ